MGILSEQHYLLMRLAELTVLVDDILYLAARKQDLGNLDGIALQRKLGDLRAGLHDHIDALEHLRLMREQRARHEQGFWRRLRRII